MLCDCNNVWKIINEMDFHKKGEQSCRTMEEGVMASVFMVIKMHADVYRTILCKKNNNDPHDMLLKQAKSF